MELPVGSTNVPLEACTALDPEPCNLEVVEKAKVVESVAAESKTAAVARVIGTAKT